MARDFRVLVFHIAEKLTSSDRDSLRYIYGLREEERESSSASLDVLKTLHQQGIYSNSEQLSDVLKTVHREDLAKLADDFTSGHAVKGCVAHHSPTQLRGRCDANIAQANSVARELQMIRGFITSNSLVSEEALERIGHELGELENGFQVLLGRCEIMHRCCTAAAAAAADIRQLGHVPHSLCHAISADNIAQHHSSKDNTNHQNCLQVTHFRRSNQCNFSSATLPLVYTASGTDISRRPRVPKKPDWIRRASSTENLLQVASSSKTRRDSKMEDSGYFTKGDSYENLSS